MRTLDDVVAMLERSARRDLDAASVLRFAGHYDEAHERTALAELFTRAAEIIRAHQAVPEDRAMFLP